MGKTNSNNETHPVSLDAKEIILEYKKLWALRITLRDINSGNITKKSTQKDSSLKKVNSFMRKLKSLWDNLKNIDSLCEELHKLKLSKFLGEIESILFDLKISRICEIQAVMKICSHINADYPDFSENIENRLLKQINGEFKKLRLAKTEEELLPLLNEFGRIQRKNLRIASEFVFCGFFSDDALLVDIIKSLLSKDKKKNNYFIIPTLISNFLKYCSEECTRTIPRNIQNHYDSLHIDPPAPRNIIEESTFLEMNKLIRDYYKKYSQRLVEMYKKKSKMENRTTEALKMSGTITDKKLETLRDQQTAFIKLTKIIDSMSDSLDEDFPAGVDKDEEGVDVLERLQRNITKDQKQMLFEDEYTRAFYEDLTDLTMYVTTPTEEENDQRIDSKAEALFEELLNDLNNANNVAKIDLIAERFCPFNCKRNRTALIEFILMVKKKKEGQIIYYCRLLATLSRHFKEIKGEIQEAIETQFFAMNSNKKKNLSFKLINATFIAELSKFGVLPTTSLMKMTSKCLQNSSPHSLQVICAVLETCGRWMFQNSLTHERCKAILEQMEKLTESPSINSSTKHLLQMARNHCDPPPLRSKKTPRLSTEKAFIRFLLERVLKEDTVGIVLKLLRKMDWNRGDIALYIRDCFLQVVEMSFVKLPLLTSLVAALDQFHSIGALLVDDILEGIRVSLEDRILFSIQKSVAYVKFLGEMYVYRLVNSQVIFETLYLIITFETPHHRMQEGTPNQEGDRENELEGDRSELEICRRNEFRIRQVCSLLSVVGKYLRRGRLRKRLNRFLLYFQRFVALTDSRRRLDLELMFAVDDILDSLLPSMRRLNDLTEIEEKVNSLETIRNGIIHRDQLIQRDEWEEMKSSQKILNLADESESEDDSLIDSEFESDDQIDKKGVAYSLKSDDESEGSFSSGSGSEYETKEKTKEDLLFEKDFENVLKESIALRKYKEKSITMSDSKSYAQVREDSRGENREKITKGRGEAFRLLTKRQSDSKPILRNLGLRKSEKSFIVETSEQMRKREIDEKKRLREGALKRIMERERKDIMKEAKKEEEVE